MSHSLQCRCGTQHPNFGGPIGGTFSPIATGMVVDATGSLVVALAIGAIITVLGACILVFMLRSPISVADLEPPTAATVPAQ